MDDVPPRLICSSITFRKLPLDRALAEIDRIGFAGVDLGALPGTCEHVPDDLDDAAAAAVQRTVAASGLAVRSINADVGALNRPVEGEERVRRDDHVRRLVDLCAALGAPGLVLPCGAKSRDPIADLDADLDLVAEEADRAAGAAAQHDVAIWIEAQYSNRLVWTAERAAALIARLPRRIGVVMDVSHIASVGEDPVDFVDAHAARIRHVHLRDADPGWIHRSIGRGIVDFPAVVDALARHGFDGALALELETRDLPDEQRPAATAAAAEYIGGLLVGAGLDGPASTGREERA